MSECTYKINCSFYSKYSERKSGAWRGLIRQYCSQGNAEKDCQRLEAEQSGTPFEADIMPSGQRVPLFFLDLP